MSARTTISGTILALLSAATLALAAALPVAYAQAASSDTLVINEVDTGGSSDDEFVELRNTSDQTLNISGWKISRCGSTGQPSLVMTFPLGTTMAPAGQQGQYLLLAGQDFTIVTADITYGTGIPADGGWQVTDQFGTVVDSVGFGNNGCTETQAAPDCSTSGLAATRDASGTDTDDNSADFTCDLPSPMNSTS